MKTGRAAGFTIPSAQTAEMSALPASGSFGPLSSAGAVVGAIQSDEGAQPHHRSGYGDSGGGRSIATTATQQRQLPMMTASSPMA